MVRIAAGALVLLLLMPYGFLITRLGLAGFESDFQVQLMWALKNTLFTAFFTAISSLFLGFFGAMGFVRWSQTKLRATLDFVVLLPNVMPSLFIILSCMFIFRPFPFGKLGIILVQILVNVGWVSIFLRDAIERKCGGVIALCYIEGASRSQTNRALFGILKKDLFMVGLFVFAISLTSFAIPLLVGGSSGTTLEVLLYERITLEGQLSQAAALGLMMSSVGFLFLFVPFRRQEPTATSFFMAGEAWSWWGIKTLALIPIGITGLLFISPLLGISQGLADLQQLGLPLSEVLRTGMVSIQLAVAFGLVLFLFFWTILFFFTETWLYRFIRYYQAPTYVLMGLCFFLIPGLRTLPFFILMPGLLFLVLIPSLFRSGFEAPLSSLQGQIETAFLLGASRWQIVSGVLWPQMKKPVLKIVSLGMMWCAGDFALSSFLTSEAVTLPLLIKSLMGHYHIHAALVLILPLVITTALMWWGLQRFVEEK